MAPLFEAPFPSYDPTDKASFSYETVVKRWPIILTGVIDHLHNLNHDLSLKTQSADDASATEFREKISEGTGVIERISKLKYEMGRDKPLENIEDDGEPFVQLYNDELSKLSAQGKNTWFTAPWLFAECYLYRLLRSWFSQTRHLIAFDPFFKQKQETFSHSSKAVYQLATTINGIEKDKAALESDPAKLGVLFKEMIQICLWGNATDLSLLTHLTAAEISELQSAQDSRKEFILRDDADKVWTHLQTVKDGRVDWILDNAGYEMFTDFVFADFLVTYTPYVSKVVFHPKLIPWFVSDVTPPDFASLVSSLRDTSFFPTLPDEDAAARTESIDHLNNMVGRWQGYLADGKFALAVDPKTPLGPKVGGALSASEVDQVARKAGFWTQPWPYWNMNLLVPEFWETLRDSGLVIFKGDLHFRKLTGDVKWPAGTPFATALGPLSGSFPILSLRTNKADVVVGVDQAVADRLDASTDEKEKKWRVNGKYALISFAPKTF